MHIVMLTRFTDDTWEENKSYREKRNYPGCVYGTPRQIGTTIPEGSRLFVLEMNNTKRRIEGVGFIEKDLNTKPCNIHKRGHYNRYIYNSRYRIDRSEFRPREKIVIRVIELMVFHKYTFIMRNHGITRLTEWIQKNKQLGIVPLLYHAFKSRFPAAPIGASPAERSRALRRLILAD